MLPPSTLKSLRDTEASAFRLAFPPDLEPEFLEDYFRSSLIACRVALFLGLILYAGFGVLDFWGLPSSRSFAWMVRYAIVCPIILTVIAVSYLPLFRRLMQMLIGLVSISAGIGIVCMIAVSQPTEPAYSHYYTGLILVVMLAYSFVRLRFWNAVAANLIIVAAYEVGALYYQSILVTRNGWPTFINNNFFLLSANIIGLSTCYFFEVYMRRDFRQRREIEYERSRSENLLKNILPSPIAQRLKDKPGSIADNYANVTVLFADIEGFTPLSTSMTAAQVVDLLNGVFSAFDELAERHGLEKIKTIGDAYMAVGGLPEIRGDHMEAVARMALEMREVIKQFSRDDGSPLRLRIGINSGPVVAGVIGTKKFIYDLWGDTVNIASRMESHGIAGAIQVTDTCYEHLKDCCRFGPERFVEVKGRGRMSVYELYGWRD